MSQMSEAQLLYTVVNILQSSVDMFQPVPHFADKLPVYYIFLAVQYIISSSCPIAFIASQLILFRPFGSAVISQLTKCTSFNALYMDKLISRVIPLNKYLIG